MSRFCRFNNSRLAVSAMFFAAASLFNVMSAAAGAVDTPTGSAGATNPASDDFAALSAALEHPDAAVRFDAILRLAAMGGERVIGPLQKALGDEREDNSRAAAQALGSMPDPKAVEALLAGLREKVFAARGLIQALLDKEMAEEREAGTFRPEQLSAITPEQKDMFFLMAISAEPGVEIVTDAMEKSPGLHASGPYLKALDDPEQVVRLFGLSMLARMKDPSFLDPIAARLGDPDPVMRTAAAGAMGEFGDQRAVPALLAMLDDGSDLVRERAMESLKALTGKAFGTVEEWRAWADHPGEE